MKLVVVESPSKAKTINKYLGNGYKVISSVGHIIDLPKSKLGIDVEKNYEPQYEVIQGKQKVINELKSEAKKADEILLATDPDREGEAISWHINNEIKKIKKPTHRIVFHEITPNAIKEALKHPRDIDTNLVNAQQARRVLDRLVGYTLSPLLWKKIRYGLSAGRVQSVALRLIVDRERERQAFKPEEYWSVQVLPTEKELKNGKVKIFFKDNESKPKFEEGDFILEMKKVNGKQASVGKQNEFELVAQVLQKNNLTVTDLSQKQIKKHPNPPFTTSTFQQAAVNVLGMTSKNAMRAAQRLYEAGHITYMRTDSVYLSSEAVQTSRQIITSKYGSTYIPAKPNFYRTKSKSAQEAHEAIRPTHFEEIDLPKTFSSQEQRVYDLIYRRALASQMSDALFTQKTITTEVKNEDRYTEEIKTLTLTATAQKSDFDGWMKLYRVRENKKLLKVIESLSVGMKLSAEEILGVQHFTEPPARYTEASLIKALEQYGIGRPSTYASIVSVIMQRTYVDKDGKYFYPTDIGFVVTDMLRQHFKDIVDLEFTAGMENDLDRIAEGKLQWQPMIGSFFVPFQKQVAKKDKEINKEDLVVIGPSDETCEICGKPMVKKLGKFGTFLSCSDFPNCKGIKNLDGLGEADFAAKASSEEFLLTYKPAPKTADGRNYLLKRGRFGEFWAHPDYPKVKDIKSLEYTEEKKKELFGPAPKTKDGKKMLLRKGKFGYFWAHPKYPEIKEVVRIKKKS